jgi:hypothetical protein
MLETIIITDQETYAGSIGKHLSGRPREIRR